MLFYESADDKNPLWGWEAKKRARNKKKPYEPWQHQQYFKLRLSSRLTGIEIPDLPANKTVEEVIGDYLRLLVGHAVDKLKESLHGAQSVSQKDIRFCVTVPATWSQTARQS